ncbi:uncharacterized protein LOC129609442 [Condylostylus longicornis]|uniref:uncharacterized protein LOC129609442 n=1 Tax=Condylostylus longicornis TaxID=2530218 RepID=UPI00244E1D6A|nr:uncharacterized protein LOC129609442 [Condylostylus longicornis]XP_055377330.1 uncharacterized protein LOC129609442 [Condylostylus longicornis]
MDTVYGTKRYLRSLMGNTSDIYGSPKSRITHNEINNSYGYRSALNAAEMSKYPYFNDLSSPNQYGYNNWGIWREQSLAPSVYSSKSRHEVKSFSIILSTAAFIVILAVISVAGLAFYFGTFKSNLDEPVMMFEGNFHIMKGDVYTTALKYNHSSTYKQKVDFYERFIEKSLRDNDLQPVKVEILGFGDGPLINTNFRTFLDIRKIPVNIRSVEEHIREAILYQTNSPKSLYKSIRVDPDTISIKRVLDDEKIKSAIFIMTNNQDDTERSLLKKSKPSLIKSASPTLITTARSKIIKTTTQSQIEEAVDSEADINDNIPAVASSSFEGSFEITKTDADITRKKPLPTKAVTSKKTSYTTARLKSKTKPTVEKVYKAPINTTLSMLVKPASVINDGLKPAPTASTLLATKGTTYLPKTSKQPVTKIITTLKTRIIPTITTRRVIKSTTTTTSKPTTTSKSTTTTTVVPTTTTVTIPTTTTKNLKNFPTQTKNMMTTPYHNTPLLGIVALSENREANNFNHTIVQKIPIKESEILIPSEPENREEFNPPKLDAHLFTTSPVLDTEPWRPIRPPIPTTSPFVALSSALPNLSAEELKKDFAGYLKNIKNRTVTATTKDSDLLFYHSFTNPVFMPGLTGIEKLGNSVVKPHPIPVQLLDDIVTPDFKPIRNDENLLKKLLQKTTDNQDLFEDIGGGVLLRKPNNSNKTKIQDEKLVSTSSTTTQTPLGQIMNTGRPFKAPERISEQKDSEIESNANPTKNKIESISNVEDSEIKVTPNKTQIDDIVEDKSGDIPLPEDQNINITFTTTENIEKAQGKPFKNKTVELFPDTESRNKQSSILANEVHPPLKEPIKTEILNSSLLFPTPTKWEYSNGTVDNKVTPSTVKKIFNETLHAWVIQDGTEENKNNAMNLSLKTNLTSENRPKVNIQDISLIFDTLASKLGISTGTYSRRPPFPASRLKQSSRIDSRTPTTATSTTPTTPTIPSLPSSSSSLSTALPLKSSTPLPFNLENISIDKGFIPMTSSTTEKAYVIDKDNEEQREEEEEDEEEQEQEEREEENKEENKSKEIRNDSSSVEKVEGEAEVEVVDPNIYDEILKYSQSLTSSTESAIPTLMTLLPVKSNSGLRPIHSIHHGQHSIPNESAKSYMNTEFREATVRDQISVTN